MENEELAVKAKCGDGEALLDLWKQTAGLIYVKARARYNSLQLFGRCDVDLDDLLQSAFLGLVEAVERFDPDGEYTFTAYLNTTLKTAFSEAAGCRTHKQFRDPLNHAQSLNAPLGDDPDAETLETVVPDPLDNFSCVEEAIWLEQLHAAMENALNKLLPVQAQVLRLRFYEGLSRDAIAEKMSLGESAVRTLENRALTELRKPKNRKELEEYIDLRTDFYYRGSTKRQESPVEVLAERRDWMWKKYA